MDAYREAAKVVRGVVDGSVRLLLHLKSHFDS